jgi:hypothetical protein
MMYYKCIVLIIFSQKHSEILIPSLPEMFLYQFIYHYPTLSNFYYIYIYIGFFVFKFLNFILVGGWSHPFY